MPPGRLRPPRLLAVAVLLLLGTGCYRNVPFATDALATLPPGAPVRLYLTAGGTAQLAPRLGAETVIVDGRVERATADDVALVVSQTTKTYGGTVAWVGERVTVPSTVVEHAERRTLDRGRTAAIVASTTIAAAVAIGVLIGQHGAGSGADPGNGGVVTP